MAEKNSDTDNNDTSIDAAQGSSNVQANYAEKSESM